MSKKTYWRLVINYADAKPSDPNWTEDSWLSMTPEETIEYFNATLRPGERRRKLIGASVIQDEKHRPHEWVKTNLVTILDRDKTYDTYKCENCGITGKRYGLGSRVVIDKRFKGEKYKFCGN